MFATNSLTAMSMMTVPDICKTPIVIPVPIPYPNITMSSMHIPAVFNVCFGPGLAENLMTEGNISMGDEAGVAGGVVSSLFMGPKKYIMGSLKVIVGTAFATRMTSLVGINGMPFNTMGASLTPAQCCVVLLG